MSDEVRVSQLLEEPAGDHPSDFALGRLMAGETDDAGRTALEAHLAGCEPCASRFSALKEERAAFVRTHSPNRGQVCDSGPGCARTASRAKRVGSLSYQLRYAGVGLAACLVMVLLFHLLVGGSGKEPPGETARLTGGARIKGMSVEWVVKRGQAQFPVSEGFAFAPGDAVGWSVLVPQTMVVRVVFLDEEGGVVQHMPAADETPIQIPAGVRTTLPYSLRLTPPLKPGILFVLLSREVDARTPPSKRGDPTRPLKQKRGDIAQLKELLGNFDYIESRTITTGEVK